MKIKIGRGAIRMNELADICKGKLVSLNDSSEESFEYICTDSRETDAKTLFYVSVGERVDGHNYMVSAAENGCRLFLCERVPQDLIDKKIDFCAVVVDNTTDAVGMLATHYAREISVPAVAITGSVGKTTTKEFVSAVLTESFKVHKTAGNYNSTVGMPLSVLESDEGYGVSVVEMGMSGLGEIEFMSNIAKPEIACVTNIGTSHLEALGTRENICRAKLEIASGMSSSGLLILNGDEILLERAKSLPVRTMFVSVDNPNSDMHAFNIRYTNDGTVFDVSYKSFTIKDIRLCVIGKQYVYAALFAISVGIEMGMEAEDILHGLTKFENAAMRQNIYEINRVTVIEDCYNASPESMRAAADLQKTLSDNRDGARRLAILGDMRELGENSSEYHREVGRYFARLGVDLIFTVGQLAKDIAFGAAQAGMDEKNIYMSFDCDNPELVGDTVLGLLKDGDIVLAKASRAVGAERIVEHIKNGLKQ